MKTTQKHENRFCKFLSEQVQGVYAHMETGGIPKRTIIKFLGCMLKDHDCKRKLNEEYRDKLNNDRMIPHICPFRIEYVKLGYQEIKI